MADREQVVDDLEALVSRGEIDGGDVADLRELGGGVVYIGRRRMLAMGRDDADRLAVST